MKVITQNGTIINVGDWDYQIRDEEEITNPYSGEGDMPEDWDEGITIKQVVHNPLPEDAIEEDIEIYFADDGVIRKESDRAAYELSLQVEAAKKELSPLMTDIRLDMATDEEVARAKELRQFIKDNEVV